MFSGIVFAFFFLCWSTSKFCPCVSSTSIQFGVYYLSEPFIRLTSCSIPSALNGHFSSPDSVFDFVWDFWRIILVFRLNKSGFETAQCWWICWPQPVSPDLSASVKQMSQREELFWSGSPVCPPLPNHILTVQSRPPPSNLWNHLLPSCRLNSLLRSKNSMDFKHLRKKLFFLFVYFKGLLFV